MLPEVIANVEEGFAVSIGGEEEADIAGKGLTADIIQGTKCSLVAAIATRFDIDGPLIRANPGKPPHSFILAEDGLGSSRGGASRIEDKATPPSASNEVSLNVTGGKQTTGDAAVKRKIDFPGNAACKEVPQRLDKKAAKR